MSANARLPTGSASTAVRTSAWYRYRKTCREGKLNIDGKLFAVDAHRIGPALVARTDRPDTGRHIFQGTRASSFTQGYLKPLLRPDIGPNVNTNALSEPSIEIRRRSINTTSAPRRTAR